MVKVLKAQHKGQGIKIAIVVSRFNEFISQKLLDGCLKELKKKGVKDADITVAWVPGSLEVPVTAQRMGQRKNIDAVICLGAVIRGETYHFTLVADGVCQGVVQTALNIGKPVVFGVLSTDTVDQAY